MKFKRQPSVTEACGKKSKRMNYAKYVLLVLFVTSTFTYAEYTDHVTKRAIDIANTSIQLEIPTLKKHYRDKLNILYEDMSRKGQLSGTPMLSRLSKFCFSEIDDYAQLIYNTLLLKVKDSGIRYSDELAAELKKVVKSHLNGEIGNISGYIKQKNSLWPTLTNQLSIKETELNKKRTNELKKINSEIDLLVISRNSLMLQKYKDAIIIGLFVTVVGGILLALILYCIRKLLFSKQQNSTDETVK